MLKFRALEVFMTWLSPRQGSDEEAVAERRTATAQEKLLAAYRTVFESGPGKEVLADLVAFCGEVPEPPVRAGRFDVVGRILKQVRRAEGGGDA